MGYGRDHGAISCGDHLPGFVVKQFEGLLRNARTARIGMNAKVKGNEYLESYTVYLSSPLTKNEVQKKVLSLEDHLHHSCTLFGVICHGSA